MMSGSPRARAGPARPLRPTRCLTYALLFEESLSVQRPGNMPGLICPPNLSESLRPAHEAGVGSVPEGHYWGDSCSQRHCPASCRAAPKGGSPAGRGRGRTHGQPPGSHWRKNTQHIQPEVTCVRFQEPQKEFTLLPREERSPRRSGNLRVPGPTRPTQPKLPPSAGRVGPSPALGDLGMSSVSPSRESNRHRAGFRGARCRRPRPGALSNQPSETPRSLPTSSGCRDPQAGHCQPQSPSPPRPCCGLGGVPVPGPNLCPYVSPVGHSTMVWRANYVPPQIHSLKLPPSGPQNVIIWK